ncbi:hypothetical protein SBADM41S_11258 [Streptomyces badius]
MAEYVDPRFRPTLWPGIPVPAPELSPLADARTEDGWIVWTPQVRSPGERTVPLPEDFYLREFMELDLADLDAVAAMMRAYGHLGGRVGSLGLDVDEHEYFTGLAETLHPKRGPFALHGELATLFVSEAQDAITTWLALGREDGLDALVEAEATEEELARWQADNSDQQETWPRDLDHMREELLDLKISSLTSSLNSALERFSIGIGSLDDRYPTLLSVAFLQLYNHLAENATIRECANETCRRSFSSASAAAPSTDRTAPPASSTAPANAPAPKPNENYVGAASNRTPRPHHRPRACRARADSHRPARSLR